MSNIIENIFKLIQEYPELDCQDIPRMRKNTKIFYDDRKPGHGPRIKYQVGVNSKYIVVRYGDNTNAIIVNDKVQFNPDDKKFIIDFVNKYRLQLLQIWKKELSPLEFKNFIRTNELTAQ
jgi:hypothetical protein